MRNKISVNFSASKIGDSKFLALGREVVTKLTNNPSLPEPIPALAEVVVALDEYQDAMAKAADGSKQDTEFKKVCREKVAALLKRLAAYVETVADGNRLILLSSGFELYKNPEPTGDLPVAENIQLSVEKGKGTLLLTFDKIAKARFYEVQFTEAPVTEASNIKLLTITKTWHQFKDLVSGKEYAVKVAGASSDENRNWSTWVYSFCI